MIDTHSDMNQAVKIGDMEPMRIFPTWANYPNGPNVLKHFHGQGSNQALREDVLKVYDAWKQCL